MKRVFFFLSLALCVLPISLWAQPEGGGTGLRWVNFEEGLPLRDAPDLNGKTIAVIPHFTELVLLEERGAGIEIAGASGRWSRVEWRYNTRIKRAAAPVTGPRLPVEGWVFGGFLSSSQNEIIRAAELKLSGMWFEVRLPDKAGMERKFNPQFYDGTGSPGGRGYFEFGGGNNLTQAVNAWVAGGIGKYTLQPQMVVTVSLKFYKSYKDDEPTFQIMTTVVFRIESLTNNEMRIQQFMGTTPGWQSKLFRRGPSEIHEAIKKDQPAELEKLLPRYGDDPNYTILDGLSLLHLAVFHNATGCAEYLIQRGAQVNSADVNGVTPLHLAAFQASSGIATFLLKNGAQREAADITGFTPLMVAKERAQQERSRNFQDVIQILTGR
jgi:hypothetical protein